MREFYPLIFSAIGIGILGLVEIALLFLLNRPWWHRRWIRNAAWMLPLFGILMVGLWGIGIVNSQDWLTALAAIMTALTFILEVALMVSLPFSGIMHLVGWLVGRLRKAYHGPVDPVIDPSQDRGSRATGDYRRFRHRRIRLRLDRHQPARDPNHLPKPAASV